MRKAIGFAQRRLDALTPATRWWSAENARPTTPPDQADPLTERVEADFQLLGVQLGKVRFHWLARRAALERIKPLHVSHRRVRLKPVILATGAVRRPAADALESEPLEVAFAQLWASIVKVRLRYPRTPWSLVLEKGWVAAYDLDVPGDRRHAGSEEAEGRQAAAQASDASSRAAPRRTSPGERDGRAGDEVGQGAPGVLVGRRARTVYHSPRSRRRGTPWCRRIADRGVPQW